MSFFTFLLGGADWFVALGCGTGIVYLVRRSRGGGLTDPGVPPRLDR